MRRKNGRAPILRSGGRGIEILEERRLLAVFEVTSIADMGAGTLRDAIEQANATPNDVSGPDLITFNIPGGGTQRIVLSSALPLILESVAIDGYTQPGASVNTNQFEQSNNAVILVQVSGGGVIADGFVIDADGSTIRGLSITDFTQSAIEVSANGAAIEGNFIGLDALGNIDGNFDGVVVAEGNNTRIGGSELSQRNLISGNQNDGIVLGEVGGPLISGTLIWNNLIGSGRDPNVFAGNVGRGIYVANAANSQIGGFFAGAGGETPLGNRIAFNEDGIVVIGDASTGNLISRNSIQGNGNIGIDLNDDGFTSNDTLDADIGPNNLQNFPEITNFQRVTTAPISVTTIDGSIHSEANTLYRIEIYFDPAGGNIEGESFVGQTVVTTDSTGNATFSLQTTLVFGAGGFTATAINFFTGDTSEFAIPFANPPELQSLVVTTPIDIVAFDDQTSLREAIAYANSLGGGTITFNIAETSFGPGPYVIGLNDELPSMITPITIDGYSQPGASANTLTEGNDAVIMVEIRGSANARTGLDVASINSVIRGLSLTGFEAIPDVGDGVAILVSASNTIIEGNFIGVTPTGVDAVPNAIGVQMTAGFDSRIGGETPGARNVIAGNATQIAIDATAEFPVGRTLVQGNYIGVNRNGTAGFAGQDIGVSIFNATDSKIGTASLDSRNVISGNGVGILVDVLSSDTTILNNYIGTDLTGTLFVPNETGVIVQEGANVTIGGPETGNLIAGNSGNGLELEGAGLVVQGNTITGNTGDGIQVTGPALIGGPSSARANTVSFNGGNGIVVLGGAGATLPRNSIFGNTGLGIDLGNDGVTFNDPGDPDTGANNLQNFPILFGAFAGATSTTINGRLSSTPSLLSPRMYRLDFFSSATADPTGFGEGEAYLDSIDVAIGVSGSFTFSAVLPVAIAIGQFVTATATDLTTGDTSEFSFAIAAVEAPSLIVTTAMDVVDNMDGLTSMREAMLFADMNPGADTITFDIPGSGPHNMELLSVLPIIAEQVTIDGYSQPGASANTVYFGNDAVYQIRFFGAGSPLGIFVGLQIDAAGTEIRGLSFSGFGDSAIIVNADDVVIAGNDIGGEGFGNSTGVRVDSGTGVVIGGAEAADRNWISNNFNDGILITASATSTLVQGNYIGSNRAGNGTAGNIGYGINDFGSNTQIGRENPDLPGGSLIVGNSSGGINLAGIGAIVQDNLIGINAFGANLGNGGAGIRVSGTGILIGGASIPMGDVSLGNTIAFNNGDGIVVEPSGVATISLNNISRNQGLGIDLGGDGATPNDLDDPDTGANGLQNFPLLTSVFEGGSGPTISGTLNSTPNTTFRIEFFRNSPLEIGETYEGDEYFDFTEVTTNANGDADFSVSLLNASNPGDYFTATATNLATGETSEFSPGIMTSALEAPSLIVTTALDVVNNMDGLTSLREAILYANMLANVMGVPDVITFNIPGSGVQIISLATDLPDITEAVFINAYSQPGASANTLAIGNDAVILVQLDGAGATTGLEILAAADGSRISGLSITGFTGQGIIVRADDVTIDGNFLGLRPDGTADGNGVGILAPQGNGLLIGGTSTAARNVISGNSTSGVEASGTGLVVKANFIGLDLTGAAALPNGGSGIVLQNATGATIGGTDPLERNVISGNLGSGIDLFDPGTRDNVIQGNYIGVNAAGNAAIGNRFNGVVVFNGSNNTIGGVGAARNVISGNAQVGLYLGGASASGNQVLGNFIGLSASGALDLGNLFDGVQLQDLELANTIGSLNAPNYISGNGGHGIGVFGTASSNLQIVNNRIGVAINGFTIVPNDLNGIDLFNVSNSSISMNVITGSGGDGIAISTDSVSTGVLLQENLIFGNGGLGIDLVDAGDPASGVTLNDAGDIDTGVNNLQNFPVITNVVYGSGTSVQGTINGEPLTQYRIEVYVSAAADPSGYGEGETFVASTTVTTDGSGNATFAAVSSMTISGFFTATATAVAANNTSEFSLAFLASSLEAPSLIVTTALDVVANDGLTSLREAILYANMLPNAFDGVSGQEIPDTITFNIPGAGVHTIMVGATGLQGLPEITEAVIIDGYTQPGSSQNSNGPSMANNAVIQIVIDGTNAPNVDGLVVNANTTTIRGLVINNFRPIDFGGNGIVILGDNNVIEGNFIGTNAAGTAAAANLSSGVYVSGANNTIGGLTIGAGNIISGNGIHGVLIEGATAFDNFIYGNFIGTCAAGNAAIPNAEDGVRILNAVQNFVGESGAGRNVISGNMQNGVTISGAEAISNFVAGNYIGLDVTGLSALGNGASGVSDSGGFSFVANNVISGNTLNGVSVTDATDATVSNNVIGLDALEIGAVANGAFGVGLLRANIANIRQNLITGNLRGGVGIASSSGVSLSRNIIGLNDEGDLTGNGGPGISIVDSSNSSIGGDGGGNTITGNNGAGILIAVSEMPGAVSAGNRILNNSIFSNTGLGIDLAGPLGPDGVTPNDDGNSGSPPPDTDTGANNLQNFPVFTSVIYSDTEMRFVGELRSTPNTIFFIDLFSNDAADPSGNGEGQTYFDTFDVTTDANGLALIDFTRPLESGPNIFTATATNQTTRDTSEFSPAITGALPTISIGDAALSEDGGSMTFIVTLSGPSPGEVRVDYITANGTATAGADYQTMNGQLVFAPGETTKMIIVLIENDTTFEANETFTVNLSGPVNATINDGIGLGTINNDDPQPTLSINDVTVTEANANTTATFTVTLSAASGVETRVDFATAPGTALAGSDYQTTNGTLIFAPGETIKLVNVTIVGDTTFEANETFTVNLSGPVNATINDGIGLGTINNDDAQPTLSINDVTVVEGNIDTTATFTVTLSAASGVTTQVRFDTFNGTAIAGLDYLASGGTLTFAPGETMKTVGITILGETTFEPAETFTVVLSNPSQATIADGTGVATINNDDAPPAVSVGDATIDEGDSGTRTATFNVTLSAASGLPVSVDFATVPGSADEGTDYLPTNGTLTFAPGETIKTISVTINGDTLFEADESFTLLLTNPLGATIADDSGLGTITNDDAAPTISISDVTMAETDTGQSTALFTVSLSAASGMTTTVSFGTLDGTALAGQDYLAAAGTVTFLPGETSKTIAVTILGDTVVEDDETFTVELSEPVNATIADGSGLGIIQNDDFGSPANSTISIGDVAIQEGAEGTRDATFTVTLSQQAPEVVTVSFNVLDGTATSGSDFVASSGVLTFAPGETSKTITVTILGDTVIEEDETFTVVLSGVTGPATIADGEGLGTILNDDIIVGVPPVLSISDVTADEGNIGTRDLTLTITLSSPPTTTVSVQYATVDVSATAGSDYVAKTGEVIFAPGETSQTITVTIIGDIVAEINETFNVVLGNPIGATIGDGRGVVVILNDDDGGIVPVPRDEAAKRFIKELYFDVLGRAGEEAGIAFWANEVERGVSRIDIANRFLDSDERRRDIIKRFYDEFLERDPTPDELQAGFLRLKAGEREEDVLATILGTNEYVTHEAAEERDFLEGLYDDLFGRQSDAEGRAFWESRLANGETREQIARGFLSSAEFQIFLLDDPLEKFESVPRDWYRDYLGRPTDVPGRNFWSEKLRFGGATWRDVQAGILGSQEYFDRADGIDS